MEESINSNGKGVAQNGSTKKDAEPKEELLQGVPWCFIALERLASGPGKEELNDVTHMQQPW
jgi:hypothetical protein